MGALDASHWWLEGDREPRARESKLESAADVFRIMELAGIELLYVHASALPTLGLPEQLDPPPLGGKPSTHPWLGRALKPSIESADGREILIGAYQDGAGDPFAGARDGRELRDASLCFAEALRDGRDRRWAFRNSAAVTGWKLMHARPGNRRPLENVESNPQPELEGLGAGAQVEIPYGASFVNPATVHPYVAAFDVNGQRLAACSRLQLGVDGLRHYGELDTSPVHQDPATGLVRAKLPGYHYVESVEAPYAGAIPAIFEPGWHTSPRVAMACYLGLKPIVRESWVWTEHTAYLDPFYNRMRVARERLLVWRIDSPGPAAIALGALKQTYLQPLGRLRSGRLRDAKDTRYRPGWYDAVIGQELARQYLRLHELAKAGEHVLAVYFDAIILSVPMPNYVPAALELSDQLGKFKRAGGVLGREQALAALYPDGADGSSDVGALMQALKRANLFPPRSAFERPVHGGYPTRERLKA